MKKTILIILGFLLLTSFASAHIVDDEYHMIGNVVYGTGMWGMGIFSWIFMVLIIVALVLLIICLTKQIQKKPDLRGLDIDERKVVRLLLEENGTMFQATLKEKLEIGKVKLTRLLDKLEAKQLIERKRRGMNNLVFLKN